MTPPNHDREVAESFLAGLVVGFLGFGLLLLVGAFGAFVFAATR